MWLAEAGSGAGDNPYSLLIAVATVTGMIAVAWLGRARHRRPEVDPDPIAARTVSDVEEFLTGRVRQLERQLGEERRRKHDLLNEKLELSIRLARCEERERDHRPGRPPDE